MLRGALPLLLLLILLSSAPASAQQPPAPTPAPAASTDGRALLYGSLIGGASAVLVGFSLYCWFDRRSMVQKYELRALQDKVARGEVGDTAAGGKDGDQASSDDGDPEAPSPRAIGHVKRSRPSRSGAKGRDDDEHEGGSGGGFDSSILDADGEAFSNGIRPTTDGLAGTRLSAGLEYLRALPDLRMPRLPGIRAVVEIDGSEISFKPGEQQMREMVFHQSNAPRAFELSSQGQSGFGSSDVSTAVSSQTASSGP